MAAKHYIYIAKNNAFKIKENYLGSSAVEFYTCSFGQEDITYCIFIHSLNTMLLNTYMLAHGLYRRDDE